MLDVFAIDDSCQNNPSRAGMGPLVAVGGIHVPGDQVRNLERDLEGLCSDAGFPAGEEFKWSPKRGTFMHTQLKETARAEFLQAVLNLTASAEVSAHVVIADTSKNPARRVSTSHEQDVATLFLERAHNQLGDDSHGIVIFDRPSGARSQDTKFLAETLETLRSGTSFVNFDSLALAVSTDSRLVRLLQVADVVTGCTLAFVGGESKYSPAVFESIRPMLRTDQNRVGGVGVKIHPDFRYGNLYHWLLRDLYATRGTEVVELPSSRFTAYQNHADTP